MSADPAEQPTEERGSVGRTVVAWSIIILATGLVLVAQSSGRRRQAGLGELGRAVFELQARYLVAAAGLGGDQADEVLQRQLAAWQPATRDQQLRVAVLAGELVGPDAALERLNAIEASADRKAAPGSDPGSREILIRLFEDYSNGNWSAPSVDEAARALLQDRLGWFGKLALAPSDRDSPLRGDVLATARQTFYSVIGVAAAIGFLAILGLFVLIVFLALLLGGRLRGLDLPGGYGGVYAEAFACWLVLFLGLSLLGTLIFRAEAVASISLLSLVGSMAALGWPLVRGVSWERVRADIGWTGGRGLLRELLAGIGCYAMAVPLVILAVLLVTVALGLAGDAAEGGEMPVHPVADWLAGAGWWPRIQLLLLACVVAPVVEETMFRGFLYRHLREATRSMRHWTSVLLCAVATSVLFAVLHPQGLPAVPGIVGIALSLAFMREWRKSLVPSILAHGLNNAVLTVLIIILLSG